MELDRVGQKLGHFLLIRVLGRGGSSIVYLGEHIELKTLAAIKVLKTLEPTRQARDRFLKEARIIAGLVHPHIIRVIECGVTDDTPYIVMNYIPRGNIGNEYPKDLPLPFEKVLLYIEQAADALYYAHSRSKPTVHCDVKPANILLATLDSIVLSDFGIASNSQTADIGQIQQGNPSSEPTELDRLQGTVAYMAPERFEGLIRRASDQYSLGIMAYEWLTGELPFKGSTWQLVTQHLKSPPPSLCTKNPDVSPEMEQVILKALEKKPEQRFESIKDFAEALKQAITTVLVHSKAAGVRTGVPLVTSNPKEPEKGDKPVAPEASVLGADATTIPTTPALSPFGETVRVGLVSAPTFPPTIEAGPVPVIVPVALPTEPEEKIVLPIQPPTIVPAATPVVPKPTFQAGADVPVLPPIILPPTSSSVAVPAAPAVVGPPSQVESGTQVASLKPVLPPITLPPFSSNETVLAPSAGSNVPAAPFAPTQPPIVQHPATSAGTVSVSLAGSGTPATSPALAQTPIVQHPATSVGTVSATPAIARPASQAVPGTPVTSSVPAQPPITLPPASLAGVSGPPPIKSITPSASSSGTGAVGQGQTGKLPQGTTASARTFQHIQDPYAQSGQRQHNPAGLGGSPSGIPGFNSLPPLMSKQNDFGSTINNAFAVFKSIFSLESDFAHQRRMRSWRQSGWLANLFCVGICVLLARSLIALLLGMLVGLAFWLCIRLVKRFLAVLVSLLIAAYWGFFGFFLVSWLAASHLPLALSPPEIVGMVFLACSAGSHIYYIMNRLP